MVHVNALPPTRSNGSPPEAPTGPPGRSVVRRRALPSGRALFGGLLVAVAAVAIFAAYRGAAADPSARYVVARADLAVGDTIDVGDLELAAVDLPPALAGRAYRDPGELVGGLTVAPLAEGDLVQRSSVVDPTGAPAAEVARQLSFAVDTDRAVNGRLDPGEHVDVLVTYSSGPTAYTEMVVAGARVVDVDAGDSGALRTSGRTVLTLALPQAADALAVAHGVRAGEVTVVRTTAAAGGDGGTGGAGATYQPDPAPDAPGGGRAEPG